MLATICHNTNKSPQKQENEDECRACGDEGLLLLCEGCPNSFHGECLEPPVKIDDVEGDWYCPECEVKRRRGNAKSEVRNFMNPLVNQINDSYPRFYSLPADIRNYFENIKTGDDGEYVELYAPVTNKKGAPRTDNNGAMKPPNYKDARDKHGNLRLCYRCGFGTESEREMIPCDYCPNEWHLDCLSPPASVVPKRFGNDGKAPAPWRCPLHIERDLQEHGRAPAAEVGQLGRKPRLRRPRNAVSTLQPFARPVPTNTGIIDLQLEPEQPDLNVKVVEMGGTVIKLPERQVILDFIKKARYEYYYDVHYPIEEGLNPRQFHSKYWLPDNATYREIPEIDTESPVNDHVKNINGGLDELEHHRLYQKSFIEQQTVHNLLELSETSRDSQASLTGLIDQLVADAPEDVAHQVLSSEMEQLQLLQSLVLRRIETTRDGLTALHDKKMKTQSKVVKKVNGDIPHGWT